MSVQEVAVLPTTDVWDIDAAHSSAAFTVRHHAVASFRSHFTGITGSYDAASGVLTGEVPVDGISLSPALERLRGHLLSPDFFNAEQHPTFSFRSTSFGSSGEGLTFEGEITLRGVTRPVSGTGVVRGPLTVRQGNGTIADRFGLDLEATIDRREFGIEFNNEVAEGVANLGWDVKLDVKLELVGPSQN